MSNMHLEDKLKQHCFTSLSSCLLSLPCKQIDLEYIRNTQECLVSKMHLSKSEFSCYYCRHSNKKERIKLNDVQHNGLNQNFFLYKSK